MPPVLRNTLEPTLERDLSDVRLHTGPQAQGAAANLHAQAVTLGRNIHFGAGAMDPYTSKGRNLLVHEIAHSLQPGANRVHRKALGDLAKSTHKKLKFSRVAPSADTIDKRVKDFFAPKGGSSFSAGFIPEWGSNITDTNEQRGLTSFGNKLISESNPTKVPASSTTPAHKTNTDPVNWPLGPNHILEIELNLLAHKNDHAIYRFTRYNENKKEHLLIEKTKVIASPPSATASKPASTPNAESSTQATEPRETAPPQAARTTPVTQYTGTVTVGAIKIEIGSGFSNDRGKIIADATELLPPPIRAKVDGVKFAYKGGGKGSGGENGHYDQETDTINVWGDMFAASHRKIGEASDPAYQVVHELTHVIDQRPLFKAQNMRTIEKKKLKALEKDLHKASTSLDLDASLFGDDTESEKEKKLKKDIADAKAEIARLDKEVAKARSIAGDELGKDTQALTTAFGKALKKDGVSAVKNALKANRAGATASPQQASKDTLKGGVSLYANVDLMEAFAENFAYYLLNEDAFKLLRPNTHSFFAKNYPKSIPATKKGTP